MNQILYYESRTYDFYRLCQMISKNLVQIAMNIVEFRNNKDVFSRRKHSIDRIGEYMKYDSYLLIWYRFLNGRNLVNSRCSNFEFNISPSHVKMLQMTTASLSWPVQHRCVIQSLFPHHFITYFNQICAISLWRLWEMDPRIKKKHAQLVG